MDWFDIIAMKMRIRCKFHNIVKWIASTTHKKLKLKYDIL